VNELIVGDEDADVRRAARHRVEEHEIARLQVVDPDLLSDLELLLDLAWDRHTRLREHPLREAAAVEPVRIASAVSVRHAAIAQSRFDERRPGLRGWRDRWGW